MKESNYQHTIYASYLGYITQAVVNNLAPLLFLIFQDRFGISLGKITALVTVNFTVQLLVDALSAKFVDRIGYRTSIVAGHLCAAAGLVGMAALPFLLPDPYPGLLCSVVLYAIGGGTIEVLISPMVEACPTDNKAAVMSLLHSFYCWGTVAVAACSTLFLYVFGKDSWRVLACLWAVLPLFNAVWFCRVPIARLTEEHEGMSIRSLFSTGVFWLFLLLMIAAGASEQAMSQWASAFAESGLGVSKTVGDLAGLCIFSLLMGSARGLYARFSEKMDLLKCILASGGVCICAYLLAVFAPHPMLSLAGCGLCGLSVGLLWPGVYSLASARLPKGGTAMFALLALAGDVGCGGGPTLVGAVAGICGDRLKTGLLAAVIFPVLLCICGMIYRRTLRNKQ